MREYIHVLQARFQLKNSTLSVSHHATTFTHSEEHKKSLILFSYTVVHPRAVMIHFPNTPFANTEKEKFGFQYSML